MTLRPQLLVTVLFCLCACEDGPSSSPSPPTKPTEAPPTAPAEVPETAVPAPSPVAGDDRCPPGQFFVHGGCHTGDSVGIAGPEAPATP